MNRLLNLMLLEGLSPLFRIVVLLSRLVKIESWIRLVRLASWKARLGAFGEGTLIYPRVIIHNPQNVRIGKNSSIAEFCHIWGGGGVTIGDDVLVASHTVITSLTHDTKAFRFRDTNLQAPVTICNNVWIGAGAIILPGITLGAGSIIGAGAVVTHNVDPGVIVMGIPAKIKEISNTEASITYHEKSSGYLVEL